MQLYCWNCEIDVFWKVISRRRDHKIIFIVVTVLLRMWKWPFQTIWKIVSRWRDHKNNFIILSLLLRSWKWPFMKVRYQDEDVAKLISLLWLYCWGCKNEFSKRKSQDEEIVMTFIVLILLLIEKKRHFLKGDPKTKRSHS